MLQRPLVDVGFELHPVPLLGHDSEDMQGKGRILVYQIFVNRGIGPPPFPVRFSCVRSAQSGEIRC